MGTHVDYLRELSGRLDDLDGRSVTVNQEHVSDRVTVHRGGSDPDIDDLAEKVAHALGKRMRREGLQ